MARDASEGDGTERQTTGRPRIDRRKVLAAAGAFAATALAGCSGGGNDDEEDGGDGGGEDGGSGGDDGSGGSGDDGSGGDTDFGGWFDGVSNFDGVTDETGSDEVTVMVGTSGNDGNYAYDPPAVRVDAGTTVVWEWTGKGQQHDVTHDGGDFESDMVAEEGHTFEHEFGSAGTFQYYCTPHEALGMKGAVVVE